MMSNPQLFFITTQNHYYNQFVKYRDIKNNTVKFEKVLVMIKGNEYSYTNKEGKLIELVISLNNVINIMMTKNI